MTEFAVLPTPSGTRFRPVRLVAETGSTNADLLAAAQAGQAEGAVLVTDHQTAGRGRQQRVWHDEPGGSLLVSVLLRPDRRLAPLVPLVTGLAAVDAVAEIGHGVEVGLKWPNDVLSSEPAERKLAGILAEATTGAGPAPSATAGAGSESAMAVVVGMGLNLRWVTAPPDEVVDRAVTLEELAGAPIDRDALLDAFLRGLERWYGELERGGPVLDRYRARCVTIGREVRFVTSTGEVRGRAVGVAASGTLLLDTGRGTVELHAGDAHHVSPPGPR
ncbi:MAG: biotin--[acetyl-CoA-carboxylase] ligase [Actinomycetota bacterium]